MNNNQNQYQQYVQQTTQAPTSPHAVVHTQTSDNKLTSILNKIAETSIAPATYNVIPSNGLLYVDDTSSIPSINLTVEPLRGADEKFIYSMPANSKIERVKMFNQRILDTRVKLEVNGRHVASNELHPADYQFILFTLKAITSPIIKLEVTIDDNKYPVDLDLRKDIVITTLQELMEKNGYAQHQLDEFLTIELPLSKLKIKAKYLTLFETFTEENPLVKFARMVDTIEGQKLSLVEINKIFDDLLKDDVDAFVEFVVARSEFGLPQSVTKQITLNDGTVIEREINLSIDLFFPF